MAAEYSKNEAGLVNVALRWEQSIVDTIPTARRNCINCNKKTMIQFGVGLMCFVLIFGLVFDLIKIHEQITMAQDFSTKPQIAGLEGFGNLTKLMVVTGYSVEAEIFDLAGNDTTTTTSKICLSLQDFPLTVRHATGGLLHGRIPIICGGSDEPDRCHAMSKNSQWVKSSKMQSPRSHASSIVINDTTLFVIGGRPASSSLSAKSTTEFVTLTGSRRGPSLPEAAAHGCFVKFNDTSAIATIGYNWASFSRNTYIYDIQSNSWSAGPRIIKGRHFAACGIVKDLEDPTIRYVVMTGGRTTTNQNQGHIASTEMWEIGTQEWTEGPAFISDNYEGASMVSSQDETSLYLIGGNGKSIYHNTIYELKCYNRICAWSKTGFEMTTGRSYAVAMLIPDILVDCFDKKTLSKNKSDILNRAERSLNHK